MSDSTDVEEFLARIRQLDEKTDREDELRAKELENEILAGRKRRQAMRQAMHSRSNSEAVSAQKVEETIEFLIGKRERPASNEPKLTPLKPSSEVVKSTAVNAPESKEPDAPGPSTETSFSKKPESSTSKDNAFRVERLNKPDLAKDAKDVFSNKLQLFETKQEQQPEPLVGTPSETSLTSSLEKGKNTPISPGVPQKAEISPQSRASEKPNVFPKLDKIEKPESQTKPVNEPKDDSSLLEKLKDQSKAHVEPKVQTRASEQHKSEAMMKSSKELGQWVSSDLPKTLNKPVEEEKSKLELKPRETPGTAFQGHLKTQSISLRDRSAIFEKKEADTKLEGKPSRPAFKEKPMFLEDTLQFNKAPPPKPDLAREKPDFLKRLSSVRENTPSRSGTITASAKPEPKPTKPDILGLKPTGLNGLKSAENCKSSLNFVVDKDLPKVSKPKMDEPSKVTGSKLENPQRAISSLKSVGLTHTPSLEGLRPVPSVAKSPSVEGLKAVPSNSSYYSSALSRHTDLKPKPSVVKKPEFVKSLKPLQNSPSELNRSFTMGTRQTSPEHKKQLSDTIVDDSEFKRIVSAAANKQRGISPSSSNATSRSSSPTRTLRSSQPGDIDSGNNSPGYQRTHSKQWSRGQTSWLESALKKNPALEPKNDEPDFIFERRRSDVRDYDFKLVSRTDSPKQCEGAKISENTSWISPPRNYIQSEGVVRQMTRSESPTRPLPQRPAVSSASTASSPGPSSSPAPGLSSSRSTPAPGSKIAQQQQELLQNNAFHQILAGLKRSNTIAHKPFGAPYQNENSSSAGPLKKASTMPELGGEQRKLKHMTRSRAKGPSRRMPKDHGMERSKSMPIKESNEEEISPIIMPKARRNPPTIRSSSRSVSTSKPSATTDTAESPTAANGGSRLPPKPRKPSSAVCGA